TVLGQRQVRKPSLQVDVVPSEPQKLALTHGCLEGEDDQRTHEWIATSVSGFKQAFFFSGLQSAIATSWRLWTTDHPAGVLGQMCAPLLPCDVDGMSERVEFANDCCG